MAWLKRWRRSGGKRRVSDYKIDGRSIRQEVSNVAMLTVANSEVEAIQ
jgi:hypothetical protein